MTSGRCPVHKFNIYFFHWWHPGRTTCMGIPKCEIFLQTYLVHKRTVVGTNSWWTREQQRIKNFLKTGASGKSHRLPGQGQQDEAEQEQAHSYGQNGHFTDGCPRLPATQEQHCPGCEQGILKAEPGNIDPSFRPLICPPFILPTLPPIHSFKPWLHQVSSPF